MLTPSVRCGYALTMNESTYTISEAAARIGVSVGTLRRWDREGLLVPARTLGGDRRYSEEDINKARGNAA